MSEKSDKQEPAAPKGHPVDDHPGPNYEELGIDPTYGHSEGKRRVMGLAMIVALIFFIGFAIWNG